MSNNDPSIMNPCNEKIAIIPPPGITIDEINSVCNNLKTDFLSLDNIVCPYIPRYMICVTKCENKDREFPICKVCDKFTPMPGTDHLVEEFLKQTNK